MIQIVRLLTYINDGITIHELNEVGISSSQRIASQKYSHVFFFTVTYKIIKKKTPNGNQKVKLEWVGKKTRDYYL